MFLFVYDYVEAALYMYNVMRHFLPATTSPGTSKPVSRGEPITYLSSHVLSEARWKQNAHDNQNNHRRKDEATGTEYTPLMLAGNTVFRNIAIYNSHISYRRVKSLHVRKLR